MLYLILGILVFGIFYLYLTKSAPFETFNQDSGTLCYDCENKTYNQCVNCFNCGFCVDKYGNGKCIGATSALGPLNNEKCAKLYMADPFYQVQQKNYNDPCVGPSTRIDRMLV